MESNMHVASLPISKVIEELLRIYGSLVKSKLPFDRVPSTFLWGPPGVGKSAGVYELAGKLEEETGKKVIVTEIRLLLFSPVDLRGVPVADEARKFSEWLMPRIFDMDDSEDVINILFLDELSAAPQSVQACAYQITLGRAVGEHKLPQNTLVIAAGNRVTDKAVSYRMPSALANRLMHFEVIDDFFSWAKWAINEGNVNPLVLGFLNYNMSKLYPDEKALEEVAFPSPRSWMFVSNLLNMLEYDDVADLYSIIAGCIGVGTTVEFVAYCKIYKDLPRVEDVFNGKPVSFPTSPDALYSLISSMTTYATERERGDGLTEGEINNVFKFCDQIPTDYVINFMINLMGVDKIKLKLIKSPSFLAWGGRHKRALTAAGITA